MDQGISESVNWAHYAQKADERFIYTLVRYGESIYETDLTFYSNLDKEYEAILYAIELAYEANAWLALCSLAWQLCINEGGYLYIRGEWPELGNRLDQAIKAAQLANEPSLLAEFQRTKARLFIEQGQYRAAQALFEEFLQSAKDANRKTDVGDAFLKLGIICQMLGDHENAHDYYSRCLEIFRQENYPRGVSDTLHQIGRLAETAGEYQRAHDLYQESLEIIEEFGDLLSISATLHQLGIVLQEMNDYERAGKFLNKALSLRIGLGDKPGLARTTAQLGVLAYRKRNFELALNNYFQALDLHESFGSLVDVAIQLFNIANVYEELGQFEKAALLMERVVAIDRKVESPDLIDDIAVLERIKNKLQTALAS